jgi:hypothetical protein
MMDAWHTGVTNVPLKDRWDQAASRMISAGQVPISPITEPSVYRLLEWLKANEPKPERSEQSGAMGLAREELGRVISIYNDLVKQILDQQRILGRATITERARSLGLTITDDLMKKPTILDFGPRDFETVEETRAVASKVNSGVYVLQDRLSRIQNITKLEQLDVYHIAFHLGARVSALEARLCAVETELQQLKQQKGKAHARR